MLEKSGKDRVDKGCCRRRRYRILVQAVPCAGKGVEGGRHWILAQEVPGAGKDAEGKVLAGREDMADTRYLHPEARGLCRALPSQVARHIFADKVFLDAAEMFFAEKYFPTKIYG